MLKLFIGLTILILIIVISMWWYNILQQEKMISLSKKYEFIRGILISQYGIIKAESFSYERLERIAEEAERNKERLKNNPLMMYEIISRTEDFIDMVK